MTRIVVYKEQSPGVLLAYRRTGEPPFAKLCSPKMSGSRKWSITYRDPSRDDPFDHYPNAHKKNKREAMEELHWVLNISSDYQLGLGPYIKAST